MLEHASGVLVHPTMLPGGRLGDDHRRLGDWMVDAGQSVLSILPLGPPDRTGSPYGARSGFAAGAHILEHPWAKVTPDDIAAFHEKHHYWSLPWEYYSPPNAIAKQVRFEREWLALRQFFAERGIELMGDMSFYVSRNSVCERAYPRLFQQIGLAGVPKDDFAEEGQPWGNRTYNFPAMQRTGYRWMVERFRRSLELHDLFRIDHFRGFVAYWTYLKGQKAMSGAWHRGPGRAPFDAARRALGPLRIVAEDLGVITPAVRRLREELGFPGMAVLQFAGIKPDDPYHFRNLIADQVLYVGTHDNENVREWMEAEKNRATAMEQLRQAGVAPTDEPWWDMIDVALRSPSNLVILRIQDVLGVRQRYNEPGTKKKENWSWRLGPDQLTPANARRLRALTEDAGRI